jgi:tRNA nucleotidyltransferase (CCA-adding enzyme)
MTEIGSAISDRIPSGPQRSLLERLGEIAHHLGTRSFLVGGPVRDLILNRTSPDLDIAVEEGSREFGAAVAKEFGGRFVFHSRFMTGTVLFGQHQASNVKRQAVEHIDITQTRAETYKMPAVLPAVRPASIVGDLGRRDFTINSMAMELTPGSFGEFIDPFDGRADLEQCRVRVLHARSFVDDPTRIFRCIRFATRLGFRIEPQTLDLMRSAIRQRMPAFLTPERILYELRLICAEPRVLPMVKTFIRERVLEATWRWSPPRGFLTSFGKLVRSVGTASGLGHNPKSPSRFRSCPAPELLFIYWLSVLPLTDRFPIRKEERNAAEAVAGFGKLKPKLRRKQRPSDIYRKLRSVPEQALRILAVLESKAVSASIRAFLDNYSKTRVAATGADLRAAGLKPGPAFREILDELLFARLDGRIRTVTEERKLLARLVEKLGTRPKSPRHKSVMSHGHR